MKKKSLLHGDIKSCNNELKKEKYNMMPKRQMFLNFLKK
jgi:hypothetical protein